VALWANEKVPNNGGILSEEIVQAVNTWMLDLKTQGGLRQKITRCNLFVGKNLEAALVPIISDAGSPVDLSYGFTNSDFTEGRGLKSGDLTSDGALSGWNTQAAEKYLDTGLFAGSASKISSTAGHLIIGSPDKQPAANGLNFIISILPEDDRLSSEGTVSIISQGGQPAHHVIGGCIGTPFNTNKIVVTIDSSINAEGGLIAVNRDPISRMMTMYGDNTSTTALLSETLLPVGSVSNPHVRTIQESSLKVFGWGYANAAVRKGYLGTLSHYSVGGTLDKQELDKLNKVYKGLWISLGHMGPASGGNEHRTQWI